MIELGKIKLDSPYILAPMAGYTDSPMRRICRQMGASLVVTELVSAEGIIRNCQKTAEYLHFTEAERPISIQIFGNNPQSMGEAAAIVSQHNPDLIDINMGCCVSKITNSGAGAAILTDLPRMSAIAKAVKANSSVPVSAKIRLGWDSSSYNYLESAKRLEDAGMEFITIHGRTRAQQYGGSADWEKIYELAASTTLPVIGNGDILSYEQAKERLTGGGGNLRAVMIGRGAIGNPWIFNGKHPTIEEIVKMANHHLDLMIECYGEYGLILMRKHLVKYVHGRHNACELRKILVTANDPGIVRNALQQLLH